MASDLIHRLQTTALEVADNIGLMDTLLDRVADYLNRRKVHKLEAEIARLEATAAEFPAREQALREHMADISGKIRQLAVEKNQFRAGDLLTLGLSFGIRRMWKDWEQSSCEKALQKTEQQIGTIRATATRVESKIEQLRARLVEMQQQSNPSLLARILRWFVALKNLLSALIHTVTGNLLKAVLDLTSVVRAVPTLV